MSQGTNSRKKQKLMSSEDHTEKVVAGPSNEESSPKIFMLTVECFDQLFEYLSIKDLHSLGCACKKLQQLAGTYFAQNYSATAKFCQADGIYTVHSSENIFPDERIRTSGFNQFMPFITFSSNELQPFQYFQSHITEFKSTNHIYLLNLNITRENVAFLEKVLPQIGIVEMKNCDTDGNLYELMLKYCEKLKRIYVNNSKSYEGLLQNYPVLEHLELMLKNKNPLDELSSFFERNPQIQRFSTGMNFLWSNRNELLKSPVKLDIFEVKQHSVYEYSCEYNEADDMKSICELLKQLHKRGFYKQLFLYLKDVDRRCSVQLTSLPGLETLCIRSFGKVHNLPALNNLKELIVLNNLNANDAEILANGLEKLERLYVDKTTIDVILPFVRQSTQLNKIKLFLNVHYPDYLETGDERNDEDVHYDLSGSEDESEDEDESGSDGNWEFEDNDEDEDDFEVDESQEIKYDNNENYENDRGKEVEKEKKEEETSEAKNGEKVEEKEGKKAEEEEESKEDEENIMNEGDKKNKKDEKDEKSEEDEDEDGDENEDDDEEEEEEEESENEKYTYKWRAVDLAALNKEREKLLKKFPETKKITIYVENDVFLATKWATKNGNINLSLIEMKRSDSIDWKIHYSG